MAQLLFATKLHLGLFRIQQPDRSTATVNFANYAMNLNRIFLAKLVERNANKSKPASPYSSARRSPSNGLNYSAASIRAPTETAATRDSENMSHDEINARFNISLAASNTR